MRVMTRLSSLRVTLGLVLTLSLMACAAPLSQVPVTEDKPSVSAPGKTTQPELGAAGTVHLGVRWPDRGYEAQALPKRTNMIRIRVLAAGADIAPTVELTRPSGGGNVETSKSIQIPSGPERTILVTAYKDEYAGFSDPPIAQASQVVDIQPGADTNVAITLLPTTPPIITSFALSGGPGSYLDIYGENFDFHNGPQVVKFGGAAASFVQRLSATHLQVEVPGQGVDGKIQIEADGIIGVSQANFQIIRQIELLPATPSVAVGEPVTIHVFARDGTAAPIENPVLTLSFLGPEEATASTFVDRVLTPSATGTFIVEAFSGTTRGTASVEVVED